MMMMMFSLSKKELLALDINLAEAPPWFQMMLAFRDVADAQSGLCLYDCFFTFCSSVCSRFCVLSINISILSMY